MVVFAAYARSDPRWKDGWRLLSLLGGIVSLVALILYVIPTFVGRVNVPSWMASIYPGGSERWIVVPLVIWLIAIGVRLALGLEEPAPPSTAPVSSS
jgi:hypothetical protein